MSAEGRYAGALAAALALSASSAARADMQADRELCGSPKPSVAIPNCALVIKDRSQPLEVRALALSNRAFASQSLGEVDDAIADYDAAVALVRRAGLGRRGPSAVLLARIYVNRGVARAMRGDPDGALGDYDAALALDPGSESARYNRAVLLASRPRPAPSPESARP